MKTPQTNPSAWCFVALLLVILFGFTQKCTAVDVDAQEWRILNELFDLATPSELTAKVDTLSKSSDKEKRADAAHLVGEYYHVLNAKARIVILKRLLQDPDTDIRACGLMACENNLSLDSPGALELVPVINKLRRDPDKDTRWWANREGDELAKELREEKKAAK